LKSIKRTRYKLRNLVIAVLANKNKVKFTLQSVSYGHSQYLLQRKYLAFVSVFAKRLSGKRNLLSTSQYSSCRYNFADGSCYTITNHTENHCSVLQVSTDAAASGIRGICTGVTLS
jgi:hypothetical protein